MKKPRTLKFSALAALLACVLLAFAGCEGDEQFEEDLTATLTGWTVAGTVTSYCYFNGGPDGIAGGVFNDDNCRFR